jgi:hypothetical protein
MYTCILTISLVLGHNHCMVLAVLLQTTFFFIPTKFGHLNSVFSILTWAFINFKRVNDGDDTPNIYIQGRKCKSQKLPLHKVTLTNNVLYLYPPNVQQYNVLYLLFRVRILNEGKIFIIYWKMHDSTVMK